MDNVRKGKIGEELAENFLTSQNYEIVTKNYRWRAGEIDIIAVDTRNRQLVFVEVKTRTGTEFGMPEELITRHKREKLIKTALHYLNFANTKHSLSWRIDLIAVKLTADKNFKEIQHFINAIDG